MTAQGRDTREELGDEEGLLSESARWCSRG